MSLALVSPLLTLLVLLVSVGAFKGTIKTTLEFFKEQLADLQAEVKFHGFELSRLREDFQLKSTTQKASLRRKRSAK
jgi:hypothetical protein